MGATYIRQRIGIAIQLSAQENAYPSQRVSQA